VTTPANVDEQSYGYDRAGNVTSQTDTRLGSSATSETQCFVYDQLDRMTAAWTATDNCATQPSASNSSMVGDNLGASSAYWTTWSYDAVGNRTSQDQHSTTGGSDTTTSYSYNGNGASQPATLTATNTTGAATSSTSYSYDAAGNMTSRNAGQGNQTLTWSDAGLLTSITGGTGGNSSFVYDADGNLLLEKDPGATTLYLPGEQITLNTANQTTAGIRYYQLPGGGLAYRTGTGNAYGFEITDLHGTPFLTLDNTAQIPAWRQFTPFGAPRGPTATWIDNRGFLNKPTDANTGLTIIGSREYDPTTGRFISLDPILEATSPQLLNGYNYASNNPMTSSDPSGLMPCADGICGSFQYLEHALSSSSGGGGGGSGGGSSGICYYCHYAPPQYTFTGGTGGICYYCHYAPPRYTISYNDPVRRVSSSPPVNTGYTGGYACGRFGLCGGSSGLGGSGGGGGDPWGFLHSVGNFFVHTALPAVGNLTGITNAINCIKNPSWGQCLEAAGKLALTASAFVTAGASTEIDVGLTAATDAGDATRVFWTGGDEAKAAAEAFARGNGGVTLGMTPDGIATEAATRGLSWAAARPMWVAASERFATGASGVAHVFIDMAVANPNSIWAETELPALVGNPGVSDVAFHALNWP
jgi:RHS repeat-associated protein